MPTYIPESRNEEVFWLNSVQKIISLQQKSFINLFLPVGGTMELGELISVESFRNQQVEIQVEGNE